MSKSKAIRLHCLECSGEAPKEVTLCDCVTCHLWPYRCGFSTKDKRYVKRMDAAQRNHPEEYRELMQVLAEQPKNGQN